MGMRLRPLANGILVKPIPDEIKKEGLLFIPVTANQPMIGEVVGAGPGVQVHGEMLPVDVVRGDKVFYRRNAGAECQIGRESYVLIKAHDVLAVVEETEDEEGTN